MSRVDPELLRTQLAQLGIDKGDVVYIKADLLHIGMVKGDISDIKAKNKCQQGHLI